MLLRCTNAFAVESTHIKTTLTRHSHHLWLHTYIEIHRQPCTRETHKCRHLTEAVQAQMHMCTNWSSDIAEITFGALQVQTSFFSSSSSSFFSSQAYLLVGLKRPNRDREWRASTHIHRLARTNTQFLSLFFSLSVPLSARHLLLLRHKGIWGVLTSVKKTTGAEMDSVHVTEAQFKIQHRLQSTFPSGQPYSWSI